MKNFSILIMFIAMITLGGGIQQANALPVGASLIDTAGLQWLSPVESSGISYNEMLTNIATAGSDYYGLRFATRSEVNLLAESYGFPIITSFYTLSPSEAVIGSLLDDFGITWSEDIGWNYLGGYIAENYSVNDSYLAIFTDYDPPYYLDDAYSTEAFYPVDLADYRLGSWLVSSEPAPVPEPSTVLLLGCGLIGLGWYGRKRIKK